MKKRHKYNLSTTRKTTLKPGYVVPFALTEVIPGDKFRNSASILLRCSPLLAPVMARADVRVHHFWIPNRIIWPTSENGGWEAFITQQSDGTLEVPNFALNNVDIDSPLALLYEHLGCPIDSLGEPAGTLKVSQLPGRAYRMVWNEWFRDPDLQSELDLTVWNDNTIGMQRACWRKDRFTLARSSPQYGDAITVPIGTLAPVSVTGVANMAGSTYAAIRQGGTGGAGALVEHTLHTTPAQSSATDIQVQLVGSANLTGVTGVSLEQLRAASGLQRYAERLQKGHRYPELLMGLGISVRDEEIQRPELLGSGRVTIRFSETLQTSNGVTGPDDVVGAMYGHGIAPGRTRTYTKFFKDWGYVLSVVSVVPEATYSNAVPRHFFKGFSDGLPQNVERLIDDYHQPELERIGDQPIFKKEVFPFGDEGAGDNTVFGYGPQYDEYRRSMSQVTGEFKPGRSLDYWTWARSFDSQPALNGNFVSCVPSDRIFADQTGTDTLWMFAYNDLRARRPVTPKEIGRLL